MTDTAGLIVQSARQRLEGNPHPTPPGPVAGWRWVPVEPTGAMIEAGQGAGFNLYPIWRAMLAAAPPSTLPPEPPVESGWLPIEEARPERRSAEFRKGVRASIAWLHAEALKMNDPHARAILNSAAFHLGLDKPTFLTDGPEGHDAAEPDSGPTTPPAAGEGGR